MGLASFVHVRDRLRRAPADLHDVNGDVGLLARLGDRDRISLEILAVGDEQHHAAVLFRLGVALEQFTARLERARNGGAADRHVVRRELAKELCDRRAVTGQREGHRLTGEGHRRKARARQILDQPPNLGFCPQDTRRSDVLGVHALRVIEHDHDVEVRGRNQPCAAAILRLCQGGERKRDCEHEEHALQCAPSARIGREQPADQGFIAEAADAPAEQHPANDERQRDHQRERAAEQPDWDGEFHGNLRSTRARSTASPASSSTPGKSRNANKSS